MLFWLKENITTILIGAGLALIVSLVVAVLIRDKKKGKSSCGGNCGHCPLGGTCGKRLSDSTQSSSRVA